MSSIYGPNSFNGLMLLFGAAWAGLIGLAVVILLALVWVLAGTPARARRVRAALWLTLGNWVAIGMLWLAMEKLGWFGPRVPSWVDHLGAAWLVAFPAVLAIILLRIRPAMGDPAS